MMVHLAAGVIIAAPQKKLYMRVQRRIIHIQRRFQWGDIDAQTLLGSVSHVIGEFWFEAYFDSYRIAI